MKNFRDKHEILLQRDKSTLVISAGDSWTFGDSLGTIERNKFQDDYLARSTQVYGRLVADELSADWINYGHCGGNNLSVLRVLSNLLLGHHYYFLREDQYQLIRARDWPQTCQEIYENERKFPSIVHELKEQHCVSTLPWGMSLDKYDRIIVLLTLTESGRDMCEHGQNLELFGKIQSVIEYIEFEESYMYDQLKKIIEDTDAEFVIGRNFTIDLPSTVNSLTAPDNVWIKLNFEENQKNNFHNHGLDLNDILVSGPTSGVGLNPLIDTQHFDIDDRKRYFANQVDRASRLWTWLRDNPLHHNMATCHPTKESHRLWANKFLNQIQ